MCDKAVSNDTFMLEYCHDRYKTQKMCDKAVLEDLFILKYCHVRYKTQKLCDIAVNDFLPELKLVPDWFVSNKMLEKLHTTLFADDDIAFFHEDSGSVTHFSNKIDILSVNFKNINLD